MRLVGGFGLTLVLVIYYHVALGLKFTPERKFQVVRKDRLRKLIATVGCGVAICSASICPSHAFDLLIQSEASVPFSSIAAERITEGQSRGWDLARQKRTVAVKLLERQGLLQVSTDDSGNQYLSLPWIPNQRVPYKSLSIQQRLLNEVCAGAFGEIMKDVILHPIDTLKNRRQNSGSSSSEDEVDGVGVDEEGEGAEMVSITTAMVPADKETKGNFFADPANIKGLYAGFPIVLASSIPQGGIFFLFKKGALELLTLYAPPGLPGALTASVSIVSGVMAHWLIRTPAEFIKTQVQTGKKTSVIETISDSKENNPNGLADLWKPYKLLLSADIPFQIIVFVLYTFISDQLEKAGYPVGIGSRLIAGAGAGMAAAMLTMPIDVCKTRLLLRQRGATPVLEGMQGVQGDIRMEDGGGAFAMAMQGEAVEGGRETMGEGQVMVVSGEGMEGEGSGEGTLLCKPVTYAPIHTDAVVRDNLQQADNILSELQKILAEENIGTLFLGWKQRLVYVGLANAIRLASYSTSRMDLMMSTLDEL